MMCEGLWGIIRVKEVIQAKYSLLIIFPSQNVSVYNENALRVELAYYYIVNLKDKFDF